MAPPTARLWTSPRRRVANSCVCVFDVALKLYKYCQFWTVSWKKVFRHFPPAFVSSIFFYLWTWFPFAAFSPWTSFFFLFFADIPKCIPRCTYHCIILSSFFFLRTRITMTVSSTCVKFCFFLFLILFWNDVQVQGVDSDRMTG